MPLLSVQPGPPASGFLTVETADDRDKDGKPKPQDEQEMEREWTPAMVSAQARDLTEALGTAVATGVLDNKRIKSYREAVTTLLSDYLPEGKDASRAVVHAILRDDEMMRVWNAGNGKDNLMLALKGIEQKPEDEEAEEDKDKEAPTTAHPAWDQAGLARGDSVLVNTGSMDRPRVHIGTVRRTRESTGEALVALQADSGSWNSRWFAVNDDPVGIVGVHNGRACATAQVPDWMVGRYLDGGEWVARSMVVPAELASDGPRFAFPTGILEGDDVLFRNPETVQVREIPEWLDYLEADEKTLLYELIVHGYDVESVSRKGAAREDRKLMVRVGTDNSPVTIGHLTGEPEWSLYFDEELLMTVKPEDLPYNLAQLF